MLAASAGATYRWIAANSRKDCLAMRVPLLLLLPAIMLLQGCGELRGEAITRAQAANDPRVMRLKVLKIFNNDSNQFTTEFRVWHIIEVEVLEGNPVWQGQILDLPFDDFVAGSPPLEGDVVVTSPADWVNPANKHKQRPFGE
jgi:hypothetical protein